MCNTSTFEYFTVLPEKVAKTSTEKCKAMTSQPLVSNSQHWGEFIVSLLSLSLLLEEKLVTFLPMYEPFEVRFWHQFHSPLLFHSPSKEHWVVIPHFPGSYKTQLQNLLSCSQTSQSSGELLSKGSITQFYKKNTLHNQKPKATETEKRKTWRQKRGQKEKKERWWRSKQEKEKRAEENGEKERWREDRLLCLYKYGITLLLYALYSSTERFNWLFHSF